MFRFTFIIVACIEKQRKAFVCLLANPMINLKMNTINLTWRAIARAKRKSTDKVVSIVANSSRDCPKSVIR